MQQTVVVGGEVTRQQRELDLMRREETRVLEKVCGVRVMRCML